MTQNTLARLARCVKEAQDELGQIRISGSISNAGICTGRRLITLFETR